MSERANDQRDQDLVGFAFGAAQMDADRQVGDMSETMVALLGRLDQPTDALRDYCIRLSEALRERGVALDLSETRWEKGGWIEALRELWEKSKAWRGRWILLQYTALMWSRRGFPFGFLAVLGLLKMRGCKTAVVFHEIRDDRCHSWLNRFRLANQYRIMRRAYDWTDRSIVTVPAERVPWVPAQARKAVFIPVGSNIPSRDELLQKGFQPEPQTERRVAVFGITGGQHTRKEVNAIAYAVKCAARDVRELRLVVFGRDAKQAEPYLRQALRGTRVALDVEGLLPPEEASCRFVNSDVLLFARGPISSRRGSALAGIACGLPVVAWRGAETDFPVTEAGVMLVPENDKDSLAKALTRLLTHEELRLQLCARSAHAYQTWFSWDRIAQRFLEALGTESSAAQGTSEERRQ